MRKIINNTLIKTQTKNNTILKEHPKVVGIFTNNVLRKKWNSTMNKTLSDTLEPFIQLRLRYVSERVSSTLKKISLTFMS